MERTKLVCRGSSTRYGGENKLLQPLDGIPVLVRTLLTIDRVEGIDEIVIAAREDELLPYAELCKTFGLRKPVKVIVGGATRTESVLRAALEASPETEFFAVQDGARPLVTVELIDEVLDAARVYLAAAPAVPARIPARAHLPDEPLCLPRPRRRAERPCRLRHSGRGRVRAGQFLRPNKRFPSDRAKHHPWPR